MHITVFHPKHPLMLAGLVLMLALAFMLATAAELSTLDFSIGSGGESVTSVAAPSSETNPFTNPPQWPTDLWARNN